MDFTDEDKRTLLHAARMSIEHAVKGQDLPQLGTISDVLKQPSGAFVTLNKRGELRGCIGYTEAHKPLVETVSEVAVKAALEDPRFVPVAEEELDDVVVEISVLSPLWRISRIEEIEVGRHGLVVERGYCRGLLLPQVAEEYQWDRDAFLKFTARKAGLPADAWKDPETSIYLFTAEIFREEDRY
ncbi:MAG: AmmeMemoRadiSam system protein A [Bacteroidota bacterium]